MAKGRDMLFLIPSLLFEKILPKYSDDRPMGILYTSKSPLSNWSQPCAGYNAWKTVLLGTCASKIQIG